MTRVVAKFISWFLLLSLPLLAEDRGQLLFDGSESLGKTVKMIREAKTEIAISSFILTDDISSQVIVDELLQAKARGVEVRFLLDQASALLPSTRNLLGYMTKEGIEVRIFNPLSIWRLSKIGQRMHGKVVVVDQEQFRTGGRNLWDRSFGIGKGGHLDTDILVKGPSAKNAQEYFDSLWESEYSAAWKLTGYRKRYGKNPLEKLYVKDGFKKEAFESALNSDDLKPIEKIEFIGDTPKAPKLLAAREREILMGSTREAFIETPWLVPTRVFQDIVEKARKKLVDLRILTNSPESAEYPFRGFISRFFSSPLINAFPGIVAEIRGKLGSHAKTTTVDGTKTLVSSYNFGPRSEGINLEAGVLVESAELASEVQEEFKRRSKDATKMMPYRKSLKFFCSESLAKVSRDLY